MMTERKPEYPICFGNLEIVFPMGGDGLRYTPDSCMACEYKTECLRAAMARPSGVKVREEMMDRAYASGKLSFFQRWSRRKMFSRQKNLIK